MNQVRFERTLSLRNSGRLLEAIREFHAMAEESGDSNEISSLMLNEARCYTELNCLADAERIFARIRELAPDNAEVRFNVDFAVACSKSQGGQHEKALIQFQALLADYVDILKTEDYREWYEDIQRRRALSMIHLGRYQDAVVLLKEASSSFRTLKTEDQQEVHLYLGICYAELDEDKPAKDEFLRAIQFGLKNDGEAQARYSLGVVSFRDGGFAQAKHQLEFLLQNYPQEIPNVSRKDVYQQLSRVYHYLGDKEKAERLKKLAENSSL
jgi:tetratricopeptide (TPR) repeat protein